MRCYFLALNLLVSISYTTLAQKIEISDTGFFINSKEISRHLHSDSLESILRKPIQVFPNEIVESTSIYDHNLSSRRASVSGKKYRGSHYLLLALETEIETGLKIGGSIGYILSPGKKEKYYLGAQFKVLGNKDTKPIAVYYLGYRTRGGELTYRTGILTLDFVQRYLIGKGPIAFPFIDLAMGYRYVQHEVESRFYWYSFLGYVPNGDEIYREDRSAFSLDIGSGCFFKGKHGNGLFIRLGLKVTNEFEYVHPNSVYYDMQGYHYTTDYTKSTFMTMSVGVMGNL